VSWYRLGNLQPSSVPRPLKHQTIEGVYGTRQAVSVRTSLSSLLIMPESKVEPVAGLLEVVFPLGIYFAQLTVYI
jgi:hypothetical protein